MITKFEKRVIAFLLAALMCCPVTAFSAVTVNAEETQDTEQQEVQTNVQKNETAVQDDAADTAENSATEVQQDTNSEDQTVNDLDDGAFIPIQEEQYEEEPDVIYSEESASEEMQQAEEENEIYAAERAANSDVPDEELEKVALGENGEQVRMATVIGQGEESVRYLFQPEESGAYYLDVVGTGGFNIFEKTDSGVEYVAGEMSYTGSYASEVFKAESGKTYYIDIIYDYWGTGGSVKWKLGQPMDITVGTYEAVISEPGEREHYRLVNGETASYHFEMNGYTGAYFELQMENLSTSFSSGQYITLDAGEECYIDIYYRYNQDLTGNAEWSVDKVIPQKIKENELVHTEAEANQEYAFEFVPEENGRYGVTYNSVEIYDIDWNYMGSSIVDMEAGKTYYIILHSYTSQEIEWRIKRPKAIEIQEDEMIHTDRNEVDYYQFVPAESGRYNISMYYPQVYDSEWNEWGEYGSQNVFLYAGETYYIEPSSSGGDWNIRKKQEIEAKEDQYYRVNSGAVLYYKFVPEESCDYVIDSRARLYDSSWSPIYCGTTSALTAGETYYLEPRTTNFYLCIEKSIPVEVEKIPVQSGGTYDTAADSDVRYTFVPEESGRYHFWSETYAYIMLNAETLTGGRSYYGFDCWIDMEAGIEYEIQIGFTNDSDSKTTWNIAKAGRVTIQPGKQYTTVFGQSDEYVFIPETTGYYLLDSSDSGSCTIYDSEWNELNPYSYEIYQYAEDTGFGSSIYLEAGQTYYIHVISNGDAAEWQINVLGGNEDYLYRTGKDGTLEILKYLGEESHVSIPEFIDGAEVESVGYGAFSENEQIEEVTIPDTVTALQYGAFHSCSNLKTVTFAGNSRLQSIGVSAFEQCSSLQNIDLPDTVEQIKDNAFYWTALKAVNISDNITEVGDFAFAQNSSLSEVTLGSGIEGIERGTFANCESLVSIEIPDNITYIGDSAFKDTGLTTVNIPESVTSVGKSAFAECSLEEVNIEGNLTYIAESAFASNGKLKSIVIPNSVTKIEYMAFSSCSSLLEIEIPDSVESIDYNAFENGNTDWYDNQDEGVVYAGKVLYKYKGEVPENTVITVEDGTKGISKYAFYWQYGLTGVQLSNTVTNIGDYAFFGCELMKEIEIPKSVTQIGEKAIGYLDTDGKKIAGFTIYGTPGSAAQQYAEENGFTFIEAEPDYTLGDVDENGSVDISDLRLVLRAVCGKTELTENQKLAADVETDNDVNIQDLRKILRYVCRKIDSFE